MFLETLCWLEAAFQEDCVTKGPDGKKRQQYMAWQVCDDTLEYLFCVYFILLMDFHDCRIRI